MWTKADSWGSAGFRYGLSLIRGMCRSLTEGEQHKVATCIVERQLERSNRARCARGHEPRGTWAESEIQVMSPASPTGNPGTPHLKIFRRSWLLRAAANVFTVR